MHTCHNIEWRQKFSVLVVYRITQHTTSEERKTIWFKILMDMEDTETQRAWVSWPRSHLWSHKTLCLPLTVYNQMMTKNLVEKIYNMTSLVVNFHGFHLLPSPLPCPGKSYLCYCFPFQIRFIEFCHENWSYFDSFCSPSHILLNDLFNIMLQMSRRKKRYYSD